MFPSDSIEITRQETGRFDRRHPVGPVQWPHFDLLWVHEGKLELRLDGVETPILLEAPDGVLLFPDLSFAGRSVTSHAEASICHFRLSERFEPCHLRISPSERLSVQVMIALSLRLARQGAKPERRARLLAAILDGFGQPDAAALPDCRIDRAWRLAGDRLALIRGLTDVAALAGVSESAFRAAHRSRHGGSAGAALIDLRLSKAEHLLATTAQTVAEIATAVGYGRAETLSHAFRRSRGVSPGAWRRAQRPFA